MLSDYQMPKTNGLELCRALREQNETLDQHLPIWLMTGSVTLTTKAALAAGAIGIFRKPFHAVDVSRAIDRRLHAPEGAANAAK